MEKSTTIQVTYELAKLVFHFKNYVLTDSDHKRLRQILIDYYCAAITGAKTKTSALVLNYLIEAEGMGKSKVIGSDVRLSVANAAFINGTSAHCLDFDDGHTHGSIHPAAPIIPAVMAVAEDIHAQEEEILKAIMIGYEVCLRIASAVHPHSRRRGFHNTSITGIFGATAAVSYLYKLNMEEIQSAYGVAASFAGGLFAFLGSGSEVKRIHPGQAARDGIHAVKLSKAGLSGPAHVLERSNGFFQAFAGEINEERLLYRLGEEFEIYNIYFKPYPCCRHLHVVMDAVYEMKRQFAFEPNQIRSINIGVNQIAAMHNHTECKNLLDAQMSMPYAVSIALLHDQVNVSLFDVTSESQEFSKLMEKINISIDDEADRMYPEFRAARVQIIMEDDSTFHYFLNNPLGEPSTPLSNQQMVQKFLSNCVPVLGQQQSQQIVAELQKREMNLQILFTI